MTVLDPSTSQPCAADTDAVWASSITRDGLVSILATMIEQASASTTIRTGTHARFERGADVVLTWARPDNKQRLGRILAIEGLTLLITFAARDVGE